MLVQDGATAGILGLHGREDLPGAQQAVAVQVELLEARLGARRPPVLFLAERSVAVPVEARHQLGDQLLVVQGRSGRGVRWLPRGVFERLAHEPEQPRIFELWGEREG